MAKPVSASGRLLGLAIFVALSAHLVSAAATAAAGGSGYDSLVDCLADKGVDVLTGNDRSYYEARKVFSKFFLHWPSAIAYPRSTEQVAAAVRCARKFNVDVHPRCGGHSNEGECVAAGALTIDLDRMTRVKLSADRRTARVQAGARSGQVVARLWEQSNGTRSVPVGQRPVVGISGLALGGGFGTLVRAAGLLGSNIISLTAVDGRGRIVRADSDSHADLLWAARGGGGGRYVIVTEFVFRTVDVSSGVTDITALVPADQAVQVLAAYQRWHPSLPNKFTFDAIWTDGAPDGRVTAEIHGTCLGSKRNCKEEFEASLPQSGPLAGLKWSMRHMDLVTAVIDAIGWPLPENYTPLEALNTPQAWNVERSYYKYKTFILTSPLPKDSLQVVMDYARGGVQGTQVFEFQGMGGAAASVPADAAAMQHLRAARNVLIMRANNAEMEVAEQALHEATGAIKQLIELAPDGQYKAYVNFLDTDVMAFADEWKRVYYGDDAAALDCIDVKYDPDDVYTFPVDLSSDFAKLDAAECKAVLAQKAEAAGKWSKWLLEHAPARA